jgi:hypothetical protein
MKLTTTVCDRCKVNVDQAVLMPIGNMDLCEQCTTSAVLWAVEHGFDLALPPKNKGGRPKGSKNKPKTNEQITPTPEQCENTVCSCAVESPETPECPT